MAAVTAAVTGVVVGATSMGFSIAQAVDSQKKMRSAQRAAEKSFSDAKRTIEASNYYDRLNVFKGPFERSRDELGSLGYGAISRSLEGERDISATAGRVQMAQNEAQMDVADTLSGKLEKMAQMSATQQINIDDTLAGIELQNAKDARKSQAQSQAQMNRSIVQAAQSAGQVITSGAELVPLYMGNAASKQFGASQEAYNKAATEGTLPSQYMIDGKPMSYRQAMGVNDPRFKTMTDDDFDEYMLGKNKKYIMQNDPLNERFNPAPINPAPKYNYPYNPLNPSSMEMKRGFFDWSTYNE